MIVCSVRSAYFQVCEIWKKSGWNVLGKDVSRHLVENNSLQYRMPSPETHSGVGVAQNKRTQLEGLQVWEGERKQRRRVLVHLAEADSQCV